MSREEFEQFLDWMGIEIVRDMGDCKLLDEDEKLSCLAYIKSSVLNGRWGTNPELEAQKMLNSLYVHVTNYNVVTCVKEFCEETDGCTFTDSYSGRYMFGKKCIGVITDGNIGEHEVIFFIGKKMHGFNIIGIPRFVVDDFGMGKIIYFPEIRIDESVGTNSQVEKDRDTALLLILEGKPVPADLETRLLRYKEGHND